jgi:hypothetical protein
MMNDSPCKKKKLRPEATGRFVAFMVYSQNMDYAQGVTERYG